MDTLLKKHFWVVNLLVIGLCAIFVGRGVAQILAGAYLSDEARPATRRNFLPTTQAKVHTKDVEDIIKRNVFCSGCAPVQPAAATASGGDNNSWQKSSLQLELVSTMICRTDDDWSMAVIRDMSTKEKDAAMFNRGKKVFATGAEVLKVVSKRVYMRNQGRFEYVEMEGANPVAAAATPQPAQPFDAASGDIDKGVNCTGNNCTVDKKLVESLLSNTAALATAARFIPAIKDGKAVGFKVYAIRPNSIFGKIGLQNGDTVKSINGMDISSPDRALEVYTKLRNATHLSVSVERRGESVGMDYAIR